MPKISLTIDGRGIEVDEGHTVLQAAREAGIVIPTVCDHKDLSPLGACRMCIVEIEGVRGFPISCTTAAAAGMVVRTQSDELRKLRNRTLELMLSGHPNGCLVCPHREACEKYRPRPTKAGRTTRCGFCSNRDECDIRTLAFAAKPQDLAIPTLYSAYNLQRDDPFMDRDYNLCILCGRCWRICEKIHGSPVIGIINRGKRVRVGTPFDRSHVLSDCTFCGACIDICPTGTLSDRYARWYGKPSAETPSTCTLCPEGCSVLALTQGQKLIANRMTAFEPAASLCALGRFAYPQVVNSSERLTSPMVREGGEMIPADWATALSAAAEGLRGSVHHETDGAAGSVAVLVSESTTREDRYLYGKLAGARGGRLGLVPSACGAESLEPEDLRADLLSGKIQAVITNGDFLDETTLAKVNHLVAIDCLPSKVTEAAHVVLPAAVLSESKGTYRNVAGEVKSVAAVSVSPGEARTEWRIIRDLAQAMGLSGFEYATASEITPEIMADPAPRRLNDNPSGDGFVNPRFGVHNLPARFRGHYLADTVPALEAFGLPASPRASVEDTAATAGDGFVVLEKREVVPNMHLFKIKAPEVAQYAKPGQFVILMAKETSERAPFTLADWNAEEGSITVVIEEVGRSSRELVSLKQGSRIAHVSGPLGLPFPIEKKGTVVLGGGCYGIGAIHPIARALKEAGNEVICAIEGCSEHLLYMEDEMRSACHELHVATKDGSRGVHGGVQEIFTGLVEAGKQIDYFVAIGCTFMMRMACEATKPFGIPTYVALNPIMVDGTGMCGACRVSIGGQTKFACADGPIFDGHSVDWDELFFRRSAYAREEIEAMPQTPELGALRGRL